MNNEIIKKKFCSFLQDFDITDYQMVVRFLKQVLQEYDENPFKLLGKKINKNSDTNENAVKNVFNLIKCIS